MSDKLTRFLGNNSARLREDVGERTNTTVSPTAAAGRSRMMNAAKIELDRIVADPQHRETFDPAGLEKLAASMKQQGQLQPCRVRWDEGRGKYVIIAGERRFRAAEIAELPHLECVIVEGDISESDMLREQIIENAIREDLLPCEQARAYMALMTSEGWQGKQLADEIHVDPATVSRALKLLELSPEDQQRVDAGELSPTAALRTVQKSQTSETLVQKSKRKSKAVRERKLRTSFATVIVKARRNLTDEDVIASLSEAIEQLRSDDAAKAA